MLKSSSHENARGLPAFRSRPLPWVLAAAGALAVAVLLFLLLRDRSVVVAVPRAELPVYARLFAGFTGDRGAPRVRVQAFDGPGDSVLHGKRPGLAVVSLAPWVQQAFADGRLKPLPASAFSSGAPPLPRALLAAVGGDPAAPRALPLAYDPWVAAWHRDFIGGAKAVPPRGWNDVAAAANRWKKAGAVALGIPGRDTQALLSWVGMLAAAQGPAAALEVFAGFPKTGRETMSEALARLGSLQRDGLAQAGSFTYPWPDALDLVLHLQAAGTFLPLSRFRGMPPASTAPLIVAPVPEFPGTASYIVIADVRLLAAPAGGARGRGSEEVIRFLAETGTERGLADALGMVPARLDAPVRDGAAYEAVAAAKGAGAFLPPPETLLAPRDAAAVAAAAETMLRSPDAVAETVAALYAGR
jgi:hypothetical protein